MLKYLHACSRYIWRINECMDTEPVSLNALVRSNSLHVPRRTTSCCPGGWHGDLKEKKNRYMQRVTRPEKTNRSVWEPSFKYFTPQFRLRIFWQLGGEKGRDWAVENYSNESFVVGEKPALGQQKPWNSYVNSYQCSAVQYSILSGVFLLLTPNMVQNRTAASKTGNSPKATKISRQDYRSLPKQKEVLGLFRSFLSESRCTVFTPQPWPQLWEELWKQAC